MAGKEKGRSTGEKTRLANCVTHFKIFEEFSHEEHPAKAKEEGLCVMGEGEEGGEGRREEGEREREREREKEREREREKEREKEREREREREKERERERGRWESWQLVVSRCAIT